MGLGDCSEPSGEKTSAVFQVGEMPVWWNGKLFSKIFPNSPGKWSGNPPKMEVWKIYTCEKKHFFLIPYEPSLLPLWLYLSSVENTQKNAWMWWIGGFLARHPELRAGLPLGCSPRITTSSPDHYIDTFLGDRTSQSKSSIFRLLSRDCTPGKLTWQWTLPTMNESCCISPPKKKHRWFSPSVSCFRGVRGTSPTYKPPPKNLWFSTISPRLGKVLATAQPMLWWRSACPKIPNKCWLDSSCFVCFFIFWFTVHSSFFSVYMQVLLHLTNFIWKCTLCKCHVSRELTMRRKLNGWSTEKPLLQS